MPKAAIGPLPTLIRGRAHPYQQMSMVILKTCGDVAHNAPSSRRVEEASLCASLPRLNLGSWTQGGVILRTCGFADIFQQHK